MLTKQDAVSIGIPPAMKDRYVVRVVQATFGLSKSSQNPMVTMKVEVAGVPTTEGVVDSIKRGDNTYQVAGVQLQPIYFPLVAGKALGRFVTFLEAAGLPSDEVDDENHDCEPYLGLLMEATVNSFTDTQRKVLTEEQREAGEKQGEDIVDNEGKPLTKNIAVLTEWLCKFEGELPF